jgi:hypothetical protein
VQRRAALLLVLALLALPVGAEEALTNQDVVKMVTAGLGEDIVIAKVREAPRVDFRLEVDDLVHLREQGVGERIVQAMLDRNRPAPQSPQAEMARQLGMDMVEVSLKTTESTSAHSLIRGDRSTAGFLGWGNLFQNYPGLHAQVRTKDHRPALLVRSSRPPLGGRYFLAKLDPDSRNGVRSLKISSVKGGFKAAFGSSRGRQAPDSDWTVPFEAAAESEGLWKIVPKENLPPGEYGWYVDIGTGPQGAGVFDFGID